MSTFSPGSWKQQFQYKSFYPSLVNKEFLWNDKKINILLEKANLELGKLESFSNFVPNIEYFISMHIGKEAIQSSKIEGTKTEFDDLFYEDDNVSGEYKNDKKEVQNYINALEYGIKDLENLPLSMRLFSDIHKILMTSVRGEFKNPGEIRKSQNWIGGNNLENAFFIPPHHEDISELLTDLEKFLHNDSLEIPELIKVALMHYQFETIHPYLDGNGRIGRLMIILYLTEKGILSRPVLYISDFFEKNRGAYYNSLTMVRESGKIEHFIKFFLTGIIETCQSSLSTFQGILQLQQNTQEKILKLGTRAENANKLLQYLYAHPIVTNKSIGNILEVTQPTVNALVQSFLDLGILIEMTGNHRYKVYKFENYIKLFR